MTLNEALAEVARRLRSGEIRPDEFDMAACFEKADYGIVACIGGWAYFIMGEDPEEIYALVNRRSRGSSQLRSLFFPPTDLDLFWCDTTPEQAAQAIDNYLTTGEPRWDDILS